MISLEVLERSGNRVRTKQRLAVGQRRTVGRNPVMVDIPLEDDLQLSNRHFMIEIVSDGLRVVDLNSTNNTKVNGRKLRRGGDILCDLNEPTTILAGKKYKFTLRALEPSEESPEEDAPGSDDVAVSNTALLPDDASSPENDSAQPFDANDEHDAEPVFPDDKNDSTGSTSRRTSRFFATGPNSSFIGSFGSRSPRSV